MANMFEKCKDCKRAMQATAIYKGLCEDCWNKQQGKVYVIRGEYAGTTGNIVDYQDGAVKVKLDNGKYVRFPERFLEQI